MTQKNGEKLSMLKTIQKVTIRCKNITKTECKNHHYGVKCETKLELTTVRVNIYDANMM